MKIKLTCSLPYTSSKTSSSTSAACSFATASASLLASLTSAAVGLDLPDEGDGDVVPFRAVLDLSVFSMALAAIVFAPSSAEASGFDAGAAGVGTPMLNTFVLAAGAVSSIPIDKVLTGAGPEEGAGFDGGGAAAGGRPELPSVGLFAIVGILCGCCCCDDCGCRCW